MDTDNFAALVEKYRALNQIDAPQRNIMAQNGQADALLADDARIYRAIAAELQLPDAAERVAAMSETLDSRLLYFACFWYRKDLLASLRFKHIALPPKPVKHIAVFCRYMRNGGAERCAALLTEMFCKENISVTIFTGEEPHTLDYPYPEAASRVVLPLLPHERRTALEIALVQRNIDTCIFFDHAEWMTMNDILCARHAGCRTVIQEHSNYFYPWRTGAPALAVERSCVYPAADAVTVLSRCDVTLWKHLHKLERVFFMPNLLTFDKLPQMPQRSGHDLLFIGRLSENKGAMAAVEVLEKVLKKFPDARLFMLGRADTEKFDTQLKKRIAASETLSKAVTLAGHVANVREYCQRASILLMPSSFEGYPMNLMEAKSCFLPCVMFDMPYLEAARRGCISVAQKDTDAMATAVAELFADPEKLSALARESADSLAEFDNRKVKALWQQLLAYFDGSADETLFQSGTNKEDELLHWQIMAQQWAVSVDTCFNSENFLAEQSRHLVHKYLQQHPVSQLLAKLNCRFPKLCNAVNQLLKKLHRRKEKIRDNGFPSYD